jgi:uncharacterized protein involved in cysteine biosynthesis
LEDLFRNRILNQQAKIAATRGVVQDFWRGFRSFAVGVSWLKAHKSYFAVLAIPFLLGLISLGLGWGYFLSYQDTIFDWILFDRPQAWYWLAIYYVCKAILYISIVALFLLLALLLPSVVASPFYEWVSVAVERDLVGKAEDVSLWQAIKLIPEELKRLVFIICVSVAVLLIPGLNLLSIFVTAFLLGWDLYDIPLARRGWSFSARLRFVLDDFWAVMGLGLWLVIPFLQFFLMPLAVTGGTLLSIQHLQRKELLQSN